MYFKDNKYCRFLIFFNWYCNYYSFNHCLFPPGFDLNRALGDLIKFNLTLNQWESRSYGHSPVSHVCVCSHSHGLHSNFSVSLKASEKAYLYVNLFKMAKQDKNKADEKDFRCCTPDHLYNSYTKGSVLSTWIPWKADHRIRWPIILTFFRLCKKYSNFACFSSCFDIVTYTKVAF